MFVFTSLLPQQVFCSAWWGCSSDVWQQLRVACFMLFICQHIMTGSSGFRLGRWVTDGFIFSLHCRIISVLKYTSMCFRSWSVKSLSKKAADSIITTTSTCWRPRLLKEVHVPEENLLDTSNTKKDSNLDLRALNFAVLLSFYFVCLHTLKYIQK